MEIGDRRGDERVHLAAHMMLGPAHTNRGRIPDGRRHLDHAVALSGAGFDGLLAGVVAESPGVWVATMSAWNRALLGDRDGAFADVETALGLAARHARSPDHARCYALWVASLVAMVGDDVDGARAWAEQGIAHATTTGSGLGFVPLMAVHVGWARARDGDLDAGADLMVDGARLGTNRGSASWRHVTCALLADAHLAHGRWEQALEFVDEGLAELTDRGACWFEPELHRLRALAIAGGQLDDRRGTLAAVELAARRATDAGAVALVRRAELTAAQLAGR